MKAWVLRGVGDLRFEEIKEPRPADGEVLIKVKAAGICGSDIPRVYKTGTYDFPTIPGHEFSGEVAEIGAKVNPEWKNKRAGVFPLIPCRVCAPCQKERYEMCRSYGYLGSRQDGGFAEYVSVPAWNLIDLPDNVSFEAAAMLEPTAVAVHAMRRAKCNKDDVCTICGMGTIGTLLFMVLKDAGVKNILVIGNKDFQQRTALKLGLEADRYCDSRTQDAAEWIMERTNGAGADIFYECVGKNETAELAVDLTAPLGKVVFVGNPASDIAFHKATYWKILRNQLMILGTWNSSFAHDDGDDWRYAMKRIQTCKLMPQELISHRLPLEKLEDGLVIMRDRTEEFGKVMITV